MNAALASKEAEREEARRHRQRDNMHERNEIASRYDASFAAFGTTVPQAADDEPASRYRARLYNMLARKLAPDHDLARATKAPPDERGAGNRHAKPNVTAPHLDS